MVGWDIIPHMVIATIKLLLLLLFVEFKYIIVITAIYARTVYFA